MIGEFPGLGRGLDRDGNLSETVDFRSRVRVAARAVVRRRLDRILPDAKKLPRFSLL